MLRTNTVAAASTPLDLVDTGQSGQARNGIMIGVAVGGGYSLDLMHFVVREHAISLKKEFLDQSIFFDVELFLQFLLTERGKC